MRAVVFFSLLMFSIQSCKYKDTIDVVNVNNEFSMAVPSYLDKEEELKPGAPFQYCNRFRNIYAIAFSDDKAKVGKDFPSYYKEQIQIIKNVLQKPGITDSSAIEIGGAKGVHTEIFGVMQEERIYYSHLLLETEDKYYQVCVWTRGEERKLKYREAMDNLLFSFKLLK